MNIMFYYYTVEEYMQLNHSFTSLKYHLVLVAAWRKRFDDPAIVEYCTRRVLSLSGIELISFGMADNHIHILFEMRPDCTLSKKVEYIKSQSSRAIGKKSINWGGWRVGYWCSTVGSSQLRRVQKYIDSQ